MMRKDKKEAFSTIAQNGININAETDEQRETVCGSLQDQNSESEQQKSVPDMELHISPNSMAAYLRVKITEEEQTVDPDMIVRFLEDNRITYGHCIDAIQEFCDEKRFFTDLLAARGVEPVAGEDGFVDFEFNTNPQATPQEREDGSIDYFNLGLFQNVSKGDVLCTVTLPKPGKDGLDIYGQVVPFKEGQIPPIPTGTNTELSEDGTTIMASTDGHVEYKNQLVCVNDVYTVKGDVDNSSGNIDFIGSVVVYGDVRENFSVKAQKDVVIKGMVEGATIEAGGSITISAGMNGMGRGKLIAGGEIIGKYFENVSIQCKGNVSADVFMNSHVQTESSIVAKGRRGALIGGTYQVGVGVYANSLGTDTYIPTTISILSKRVLSLLVDDPDSEPLDTLLQQKERHEDELEKIVDVLEKNAQALKENPFTMKKIMMAKLQLSTQIKAIERQIEEKENTTAQLTDYKVVALHRAYPGVKIVIGPFSFLLQEEYHNHKFYADSDGIVTALVTPSDKIY